MVSFLNTYARIFFALSCLIGMSQTAMAGAVNHGSVASQKGVRWTVLTFNHSKLLSKLTVRIHTQSPTPMCDAPLTKMGAGLTGCSKAGNEITLLATDMTARGLAFLNVQYSEKVWFNAEDGRAYRRMRWRKKNDPWVKIYCWTDNGVRRQKIRPAGPDERKQAPAKWTRTTESFYPYPENTVHSEAISDPTLLLYVLSALEPGRLKSPLEMYVFGKKQLHRLICRQEKSLPMAVSFKLHSSSGVTEINTTMTPLVFSIDTEVLGPENGEPETFSFFGLQKDIRIYLDASRRLPIRVRGENAICGDMVLELSDARLDQCPAPH
ncbi:MAG: hypothetical protein JRD04_02605 [Deltaproteobacteria bacterium]|nr:hypothetical protein [Deltaproteobacteria bacterium]